MTEKTIVRTDTRPAVTIHDDFSWLEGEWQRFDLHALALDATVARYMAEVEDILSDWHLDWDDGHAHAPGREIGQHAEAIDADLQDDADIAVWHARETVHARGTFWVAAE